MTDTLPRAAQTVQKTYAARINLTPAAKDGKDPEAGTFEAIVSVFGVEDSYGDVVQPGAFTKSLAEWVVRGRPIPVVWSHDLRDPDSILGHYESAEETSEGLVMRGRLDLGHPKAARVYALMQQGLIAEFSWSGTVREYDLLDSDDGWWPAMSITDVDLWEAGPCFKGANPDTELLSVKSDGHLAGRLLRPDVAKAGRVLSQKNYDALIAARDQINDVIAQATPEDPEPADDAAKSAPAPTDVQRASAATPQVRAQLALAQIH